MAQDADKPKVILTELTRSVRVIQQQTDVIRAAQIASVLASGAISALVTRETPQKYMVAGAPQGPPGRDGVSGGGSLPPFPVAFGDASHILYTAPSAGVFTIARLDIETPFNGAGAALSVGVMGDVQGILAQNQNDPKTVADYEVAADYPVLAGTGLWIEITPGAGASQGAAVLYITFVPSE